MDDVTDELLVVAVREGRRELRQDRALEHVVPEGRRVSPDHAADALVRGARRDLVPAARVRSCILVVQTSATVDGIWRLAQTPNHGTQFTDIVKSS